MHDAVYTVTPIVHGNYLQHWLIDSQAVLAASTMQDVEHGSNIADYIRTMERLRDLPVRIVHAGHDPSFGRERLLELIDQYLERRRAA